MSIVAKRLVDQASLWYEVGLCLRPGTVVLVWDSAPPPEKRGGGQTTNFQHMSAKRLDGIVEMLLGIEAGLGPGHNVLDGDP